MKKNIFNAIITLSFLLILFCRCSDDDAFQGRDNYIATFSIEKDGIKYVADINDNEILLSIPKNVDLSNANAIYKLSESAKITPDPKSITDWNEAKEFTVTSYNNSERTYKYEIKKVDSSVDETIVLTTQEEVNNFGKRGITYINGHLIIGSDQIEENADTIKDLNALSSLTHISGNIIIKKSFKGSSLDGLSNLLTAGNIYIGSTSNNIELLDSTNISLKSLTTVGDFIINENKIKSIDLPALTSAYNLFINSKSLNLLNLNSLSNIWGNINIQSGTTSYSSTANNSLSDISIPTLKSISGSLTIQGMINVKNISMPELQKVDGYYKLNNLSATSKLDNSNLSSINGDLNISNLKELAEVSFPKLTNAGSIHYNGYSEDESANIFNFESLEKVGLDLDLRSSNASELNLTSLQTIGNNFNVSYFNKLEKLNIPLLKSCVNINFTRENALLTLDFSHISNLQKVELVSIYNLNEVKLIPSLKTLELNGGSYSNIFPKLQGITNCDLLSISNYNIPEINIESIKSIGKTDIGVEKLDKLSFTDLESIKLFELSDYNMTTLSAPKLQKAENIDLSYIWNLTDINLSSLTEISNELKISGGRYESDARKCKLSNLNFLSNVNKIGSVNISWIASLNDFSGLSNAKKSLSKDAWKVFNCLYNPSWEDFNSSKYTDE